MVNKNAERPLSDEGLEYHLHTKKDAIAPLCLLVGAPERANMIAETFFKDAKLVGEHRGLRSYSGFYKKTRMSVVTTGMGAPSLGIILPEAYRCGARLFIRVGSCSTLLPQIKPGDVVIINAAIRFEGTSRNWAPEWYPAIGDHKVVSELKNVAQNFASGHFWTGIEATTDCFNEGQARHNIDNYIPNETFYRHQELLRLNVACYSMEASALFIWCATHRGGIPAGAINAVYGNRITNDFMVAGDELAAQIALEAMLRI